MKKGILFTGILIFCFQIQLFAQDASEIVNMLQENSKNKYLKDFKVELEPKGEVMYSLVLSKNTTYTISWSPANNVVVELFKDRNDKSILPKSINIVKPNLIISCDYDITKGAVYHLSVRNLTDLKENAGVILCFKDHFESPDAEEVVQITSENKKQKVNDPLEDEIFFVVEEMPQFKYESDDFSTTDFKVFIEKQLKYPEEAKEKEIEGRVIVQFTVSREGYLKDAKVVRSVHPALDQEVLRVIYSSPKWVPGKQRGHLVNVSQTFPVEFSLKDK